ncbi:hypothetical protein GF345_03215 [Candidatus Woesearchaeota archaeon]|nr:hypothetical protein [Candidatus Woesearchaeota archaeon]
MAEDETDEYEKEQEEIKREQEKWLAEQEKLKKMRDAAFAAGQKADSDSQQESAEATEEQAEATEKQAESTEEQAEATEEQAEETEESADASEEVSEAKENLAESINEQAEAKKEEAEVEEGLAKRAWNKRPKYDWDKEKRQANAMGRGAAATARGTASAAKGVSGAGKGAARGSAAAGKAMGRGIAKGMSGMKSAGYGMASVAAGTAAIAGGITMFFYITLGVHIIDVITGFGRENSGLTPLRFSMYVIIMLYAWFAIFGGARGGLGSISRPAIISGVAFFLPIVINLILNMVSSAQMADTITSILIFVPVWPVVTCFALAPAENRHLALWRIGFVLFWVVIALPTIYSSVATDLDLGQSRINVLNAVRGIVEKAKNNLLMFGAGVKALPSTIMGGVERQIQYATGDYYTGMVDENAEEPLGVYLLNIQTARDRVFTDEAIYLWGVIRARTLNPDNPIDITTSCYATHEDFNLDYYARITGNPYGTFIAEDFLDSPSGSLSPSEGSVDVSGAGVSAGADVDAEFDAEFMKTLIVRGDADSTGHDDVHEMSVAVMDEKDISCEFPPGSMKPGVWTAYFSSKFNFDTHSYLQAYFIDQERLRSIRRQNNDPFSVLGITNRNPSSLSTNGPVQVNLQVTQPLTSLSRDEKSELRLGITLQNRWEGRIMEIDDLYIKVPPSMSIASCDHNIRQEPCAGDECEQGQYSVVYRLQQNTAEGRRGADSLRNIEYFQSINCKVSINNANAALGVAPYATHFFKVSTEYIYELRKSIPITVEE